jgi:hypothetical protein
MKLPGIYSQRDGRWSGIELGFNTDPGYTIYHYGCGVTAAANLIWWTSGNTEYNPGHVNQWLKEHGGYSDGANVNAGGLIIWGALANLMAQFGLIYHGFSTNRAAVANFMQADASFALVQLTAPGFPMHFCAMPYVEQIGDSWDAALKPLKTYSFVGAHLFSVAAQPVPTPPVPEPAPIQTPAVPPAPDPVPSSAQPQGPLPVDPPVPTPVPVIPVVPTPGDISITVTTGQPEYVSSYVGFPGGPQIKTLTEDAAAIDMTAQGAPKRFEAGQKLRLGGTFEDQGKTYYRGTSGDWYGIATEAFNLPARTDTAKAPGFWALLMADPIGAFIRLFARNRK